MVDGWGVPLCAQPSTAQDMTQATPPPRCAATGCGATATGFSRFDGDTVVIMIGQPRRADEIPLCTRQAWNLSRKILPTEQHPYGVR